MSTLVILALVSGAWVEIAQFPVESCGIGGQVALVQWQQLHPEHAGRAIKLSCERGVPA